MTGGANGAARSSVEGPLSERIVASAFPESDEALIVDGVSASDLAERFGTPLYAFSARALRARAARVKAALGPEVEVLFALKANPSLAVAHLFREAGLGAEVASAGEIEIARAAGFEGRHIQFAGPGKHGEDFARGLALGLLFNVESRGELLALARAARAAGARARVGLRVNPPEGRSGARLKMGGGSAKFGVDLDALPELAAEAEADPSLALESLHLYGGTQTFDHAGWLSLAEVLLEAAEAVEARLRRPLAALNFGGGFGVPVFERDPEFDLEAASAGLRALLREAPPRRTVVELGRYLSAEAGAFLTRVLYTKASKGETQVVLDGGMNHHAAAAGLGTVIRRSFPVVKANALRAPPAELPGCLGGPLCTPADAFPKCERLPELDPGDLVAFLSSGAYGLTFSSVLFLGHPAPAEVLVDRGAAHVIRAGGTVEDALAGQRLPGAAADGGPG